MLPATRFPSLLVLLRAPSKAVHLGSLRFFVGVQAESRTAVNRIGRG